MSTPVTNIYDKFLKSIGKDKLLELDEYIVEDLMLTYLEGAISEISLIMEKEFVIEGDSITCYDEITKEDVLNGISPSYSLSLDEQFILVDGMILFWLKPKINTQDLIRMRITDGDYSMKSPASLLNNLIKLKQDTERDMYRRIVRYSYKGKDINE